MLVSVHGSGQVASKTYKSVLVPLDALLLVGIGVGVAVDGTGLAAEESVERGADLVTAAGLEGVALSATGLEETSALLSVTCRGRKSAIWNVV